MTTEETFFSERYSAKTRDHQDAAYCKALVFIQCFVNIVGTSNLLVKMFSLIRNMYNDGEHGLSPTEATWETDAAKVDYGCAFRFGNIEYHDIFSMEYFHHCEGYETPYLQLSWQEDDPNERTGFKIPVEQFTSMDELPKDWLAFIKRRGKE